MSRFRARTDQNHRDLVTALRQYGWLVLSLADIGKGAPDAVAYHPSTDRLRLLEFKRHKGLLTEDQRDFQSQGWPVVVLRTIEQVAELK